MSISACRNCRSSQVFRCFSLQDMPLAGAFLPDIAAAQVEAKYPITVWACDDCGLVQIEEQIDPDILFRQYNFSTRTVPALVKHFQDYAEFLAGDLRATKVVEFGCNDGQLLEFLREQNVSTIGVDAAGNILDIARESDLDVIHGYFDPDTAETILAKFGHADVVTGSNCFAHNTDPSGILEAARRVLTDDGYLILEVMYAGDLLEKLQWDTLYHEHLAVYSLGSLEHLLSAHGFSVLDVFHLDMHAGSLRVLARPQGNAEPSARVVAMREREERMGLCRAATWLEFGRKAQHTISLVRDVLNDIGKGGTIWAYGASGRATMWINASRLDIIEKVLDSSPLRAGKFMPGLHQPIEFPSGLDSDMPDYMLVTAWNYADSIRAKEVKFKGKWITPLPQLTFY